MRARNKERWAEGLDRCRAPSRQMVELEENGETRERMKASPEHEVNMKMREKKLRRKKKDEGEIPYMQSNTHVPHAQSRTRSRSH